MKVSIITVVYNGTDTIEDCLCSVLSQDYPNVEYIIIDGASTDGTVEKIRQFDSSKFPHTMTKFISEPDSGIYNAMNKGIGLATGEVIGILNADDIYQDAKVVSKIVHQFEQTKADAIYADLVYVNKTNTDAITRYWKSGSYKNGAFLWGWMPPHPTFFVKYNLYQQFGVFNETLRIAADYELMLRFIHKHKASVAYLPEVVVRMRVGGVSNTDFSNRLKAHEESRKAWTINGLKPSFLTLWMKPLRKFSQFFLKNVTVY